MGRCEGAHQSTKHGVSFELAQHAFLDAKRVIVPDLDHSGSEQRYFCLGWVDGGVMTVRFTWRGGRIRIIGAGYWRKESESMKKRTVRYTEGEIGKIGSAVKDFLPSPDQLVLRESNVKVTLSLSQKSVDFFKREAKKSRVPYQRMIRALVDAYAEKAG
jgi:uncharacterized DUF497 family protein